MTSATKRKHVVKEMLDDFSVPEDHQTVVKVLGSPGSNLHEVLTPERKKILCSLPVKFRKNIWIKRGDFVVIESIEEGDKVKAEIVRILYPQHVKSLQKDGNWPKEFSFEACAVEKENDAVIVNAIENIGIEDKKQPVLKESYIMNVANAEKENSVDDDYYSSDDDDMCDIPENTNRPTVYYEDDSTSESDCDGDSSVECP